MQKVFVENKQINGDKITLEGLDVKHIIDVLRMKIGENLQVCDIESSKNYICEITEIFKDRIETNIVEKLNSNNESNVEIDLYQGLPKADKMELIIQKTTEIGVNRIIPVDMIRCVAKLNDKDMTKKLERWQKIALSAAQQSKRDKIPKIENKIELKEIVNRIKDYDIFIVAYEDELDNKLKNMLKSIDNKNEYKIGVLIGPEGGIDKKEVEELEKAGAKLVTLGKRILRCETAPINIVSNIIYELEN